MDALFEFLEVVGAGVDGHVLLDLVEDDAQTGIRDGLTFRSRRLNNIGRNNSIIVIHCRFEHGSKRHVPRAPFRAYKQPALAEDHIFLAIQRGKRILWRTRQRILTLSAMSLSPPL